MRYSKFFAPVSLLLTHLTRSARGKRLGEDFLLTMTVSPVVRRKMSAIVRYTADVINLAWELFKISLKPLFMINFSDESC